MKKYRVMVIALLVIAALSVAAYSVGSDAEYRAYGQAYKNASDFAKSKGDVVLATYNGVPIMKSTVEYQKSVNYAGEVPSDVEIIDRIITSVIMVEDAEERGLGATEQEIDTYLDETIYASYKTTAGKESIDAYCKNAGLSFEEYVTAVREQASNVIAKAKLEDAVALEYCNKNGIKYDKMNPSQGVKDAVEEYKAGLLQKHKAEIEYYVD